MTRPRSLKQHVVVLLSVFVLALVLVPVVQLLAATTYTVQTLPVQSIGGSEIVDVSEDNRFAVVVGKNDANFRVRLIKLDDTSFVQPSFDLQTALTTAGYNLGLTEPVASSVAISPIDNNNTFYAAVTLRERAEMTTNPGKVVLININAAGQGSLRPGVAPITVGINPESVDIALSGEYAVVANQGGMTEGRAGTISVIDLRPGAGYNVQTYTPETLNNLPQPETVAISRDSARAFVTLQRSNAISILEFNTSTVPVSFTRKTQALPTLLRPDGLAVSPDGNFLVTANEQAVNKSVSLFRVNKDTSTLTLLQTLLTPAPPETPFGYTPEMAAMGFVGGQLRAFFSLQQPNAIGVYNVIQNQLVLDTIVSLNPAGQPAADSPEGVAFADAINMLVVANSGSRNVSTVRVVSTEEPTPVPPRQFREYFPVLRK